jgi:hypothetical protein
MPLTKLQFKPGINRENTSYSNEGGWYDCDKIRFKFGMPQKIGGWQRQNANTFLGTCRALKSFVTLAGLHLLGVGTHLKYYLNRGGDFNDITPLSGTKNIASAGISTTDESTTITVTTTASHDALVNDFVTIAGVSAVNGVPAADINKEHQITEAGSTTFKVVVSTAATSTGTGGGSSGTAAFQINTGLDSTVFGTGWGTGSWNTGTWGRDGTLTASGIMRLWSHDNFGEDLIINVRDGGIYYWDTSADTLGSSRATELKDLSGAESVTPTIAKQIMVSDRASHVIAFGCDPEADIGTQDPLLIRFSSSETPLIWSTSTTTTAGELVISRGSTIVTAVKTRLQILVITDVSVHAMQYLGDPYQFGITTLSENTTIMSPNAAKAVGDAVFWMGYEDFYVYDGRVQKLPCTIRRFVFNDFNLDQKEKVFAALNSTFDEVWWFYPSGDASEIDRYVIFNYVEKVWSYGTMVRTAWMDRGVEDFPIATDASGVLIDHEKGINDQSTATPAAIDSYIESSQIDIGDGENFVFLRRMIPDVSFDGSTDAEPTASFTLKTRNFPGVAYSETNANTITQTQAETTSQVALFTDQVHVRLRGRSFALKVQNNTTGVQWRLGTPRLDIRQDGRR